MGGRGGESLRFMNLFHLLTHSLPLSFPLFRSLSLSFSSIERQSRFSITYFMPFIYFKTFCLFSFQIFSIFFRREFAAPLLPFECFLSSRFLQCTFFGERCKTTKNLFRQRLISHRYTSLRKYYIWNTRNVDKKITERERESERSKSVSYLNEFLSFFSFRTKFHANHSYKCATLRFIALSMLKHRTIICFSFRNAPNAADFASKNRRSLTRPVEFCEFTFSFWREVSSK